MKPISEADYLIIDHIQATDGNLFEMSEHLNEAEMIRAKEIIEAMKTRYIVTYQEKNWDGPIGFEWKETKHFCATLPYAESLYKEYADRKDDYRCVELFSITKLR